MTSLAKIRRKKFASYLPYKGNRIGQIRKPMSGLSHVDMEFWDKTAIYRYLFHQGDFCSIMANQKIR